MGAGGGIKGNFPESRPEPVGIYVKKSEASGRFTAHVHILVGEKQSSGLWWSLVLALAAS